MHDLVEGAAVVALQRRKGAVGRVPEVEDQGGFDVLGQAEHVSGELLVADTRVAAADGDVGRRELDEGRRLAEVEVRDQLSARVVQDRQGQGDRRSRVGDVLAAPPDLREPLELLPVGDEDEVPGLPVFGRRGEAAGGKDPVEIGVRDRLVGEPADVATGFDRFQRLYFRPPSVSST
jgi:hypothetical protein